MNRILKALPLAALAIFAALLSLPAAAQNPRYTGSGTITTNASIVTLPTRDYAIATVTVHGTYAGVGIVFEFSDDGTNWYPDTCSRSDTPVQETGETLASNAALSWDCGVVATSNFRVRATAYSSGTATVNLTMTQDQIEPAGTIAIANQATLVQTLSAAGTASTVKATAGLVFGVSLVNNNAAVVFVEFFNTTSVTLGTTTPVLVLVIPASSTLTLGPTDTAMISNSTAVAVAAVTAFNGATPGSVSGSVFYR
jgi:hypothetical protein